MLETDWIRSLVLLICRASHSINASCNLALTASKQPSPPKNLATLSAKAEANTAGALRLCIARGIQAQRGLAASQWYLVSQQLLPTQGIAPLPTGTFNVVLDLPKLRRCRATLRKTSSVHAQRL